MRVYRVVAGGLLFCLSLTGCQHGFNFRQRDAAGSDPFIAYESDWDNTKLARLIDPTLPCVTTPIPSKGDPENLDCLATAFKQFPAQSNPVNRRNGIQEFLLAVSERRCSFYKLSLRDTKSGFDFITGALSTATAGAASIITATTTSHILSGSASVLSGTRAEFDQAYYANLASEVIIDAINQDRQNIYDQITRNGQSKSIETYSLEAAVKDAVIYHDHCSVATALQLASKSIKYLNNPGIDELNKVLVKANVAKTIMTSGSVDPTKLNGISGDISTSTVLIAGTQNQDKPASSLDGLTSKIKSVTDAAKVTQSALSTASMDAKLIQTVVNSAKNHSDAFVKAFDSCSVKATNSSNEVNAKKRKLALSKSDDDNLALSMALTIAQSKDSSLNDLIGGYITQFTSTLNVAIANVQGTKDAANFEKAPWATVGAKVPSDSDKDVAKALADLNTAKTTLTQDQATSKNTQDSATNAANAAKLADKARDDSAAKLQAAKEALAKDSAKEELKIDLATKQTQADTDLATANDLDSKAASLAITAKSVSGKVTTDQSTITTLTASLSDAKKQDDAAVTKANADVLTCP